jgi:hypothetical protein
MSRVFRRVLLSVVVCSSLLGLSSQVTAQRCGVERWSIKTGTDSDAADVDLANPQNSSIAELVAIDPPRPIPPYRVAPTEDTVFVVNATLTAYRWEDGPTGDSDYHLVLEDDQGNTMVAEIPDPNCVGDESPFASLIASARAEFDAVLTATTRFRTANIPVQITGVGFFDFFHDQRGAAPNVIELHPVLDIAFNPQGARAYSSSARTKVRSIGGKPEWRVQINSRHVAHFNASKFIHHPVGDPLLPRALISDLKLTERIVRARNCKSDW